MQKRQQYGSTTSNIPIVYSVCDLLNEISFTVLFQLILNQLRKVLIYYSVFLLANSNVIQLFFRFK